MTILFVLSIISKNLMLTHISNLLSINLLLMFVEVDSV